MSTNYYIRKKPSKEQIAELKKLIDLSAKGEEFNTILSKAHKLYDLPDKWDASDNWGVLHIGHRSAKWKFTWCPNLITINSSYMNENNEYVTKFEHKTRYPLTKQGIHDFIMNDNYVVVNEYNEILDKKEFLEMAFNWEPDGYDSVSYIKASAENSMISSSLAWSFSREQEPFKELGYTFELQNQTDFESDGLRFTIFEDFI